MPGRESIATIYSNTLYLYYCNFHKFAMGYTNEFAGSKVQQILQLNKVNYNLTTKTTT